MSTSTVRSAYPATVETLLPRVRALAEDLGEPPSRNRVMKEFKVGPDKAKALLGHLHTDFTTVPPVVPVAATTDLEPAADTFDVPAVLDAAPAAVLPEVTPQVTGVADLDTTITDAGATEAPHAAGKVRSWQVWVLALPAFVAIWSGWVGLGELTGFGVVHPLPGIAGGVSLNTAITLPIGVETYAAYALSVWLSGGYPVPVRRFARWSAIGSLMFGAAGQVAYHLMTAAGITSAPWWITTAVSCLPVAVLGMGAALAHLIRTHK
ncbi:ABC transporter permease [Dactylosporangium sp. NPDC000555]|uniref:ABC transporter permease n=1 Tax=Dactylosporangium sp. NPDC000555 TaxID=3154260 RepID=UPI003328CFDA